MRYAYPLLFILLAIISASTWIYSLAFADPKDEAITFLTDIKSGVLAKSVKHFGGNACRCPAKGGWGSYLIYQSGQEPNLAFLTGHDFELGTAKATQMQNTKPYVVPWERPEDYAVDVPISFDAIKYSPLFLPLPMAYGKKMTEAEFEKFLQDPDKDAWKGFTLRFRPGVHPGAIAPPTEAMPPETATEFEALNPDKPKAKETEIPELTEDAIRKTLGADSTEYLHPADPGPVIKADGSAIPIEQIEARLPRLKSATLRLHVVRRGQIKDWTIYHFGFMYPVLSEGTREIHVTHDRRPD